MGAIHWTFSSQIRCDSNGSVLHHKVLTLLVSLTKENNVFEVPHLSLLLCWIHEYGDSVAFVYISSHPSEFMLTNYKHHYGR